jgi:anhydro-N-acetylmuramic acid kinase
MKIHRIIGIMSGTSLDGVDLAYCIFKEDGNSYTFSIGACETIPFPFSILERLKSLPEASALEYAETHTAFGRYLGELTRKFIYRNDLTADFVASHGHTIFHNPSKQYTSQIGEGASIAAISRLPVICDFRTGDVAAGGQGAPLVPIGDELLFAQYDYCLNLGGFANISMRADGNRIAFDVSPANIILNYIAGQKGKSFDKNGEIAASGNIHDEMLQTLNGLSYYHLKPPKSLGREWIEKEVIPMFTLYNISTEDAACTFCEHIAMQISACLADDPYKQMLITGGGAFNTFLINRIAAHTKVKLIIPDADTVNYKEALVFAFLGLLRMQGKANSLSSVTGALRNVSGGAVYLP